jgi:hypothetical protein
MYISDLTEKELGILFKVSSFRCKFCLQGRMLLFIRKVIKVFGGQNREMRNAKASSTNSDHYVLKIWKYCELLSLLQQEENILGVWSRETEGKTNRNLIFTTPREELLRTNAILGVSPRLWLNVSKNFERSGLLDPEYAGIRKGMCNTHCFSNATMVVQTHLSVTLYVRYLNG